MHELGIAQNILQIVQQSVPPHLASDVRGIRLRVGKLSGVVPDSLDFCFGVMVSQTEMTQASLDIEQIPIVAKCKDCGHRFEMEDWSFSCPACKGLSLDLISGRELEVVEIVLAEDEGKKAL